MDATPPQLLDRDERLVDVCVFGDEECAEMEGKFFGAEDMGRGFGEDWLRFCYDKKRGWSEIVMIRREG